MENIDAIYVLILLPLILFGPPVAHEMWTKRKKKEKIFSKHTKANNF